MRKFITIMITISCAAMFSGCASSPQHNVYPESTPYYGTKTSYYPQQGPYYGTKTSYYPQQGMYRGNSYVNTNQYNYTPHGNTYYRVATNY